MNSLNDIKDCRNCIICNVIFHIGNPCGSCSDCKGGLCWSCLHNMQRIYGESEENNTMSLECSECDLFIVNDNKLLQWVLSKLGKSYMDAWKEYQKELDEGAKRNVTIKTESDNSEREEEEEEKPTCFIDEETEEHRKRKLEESEQENKKQKTDSI